MFYYSIPQCITKPEQVQTSERSLLFVNNEIKILLLPQT